MNQSFRHTNKTRPSGNLVNRYFRSNSGNFLRDIASNFEKPEANLTNKSHYYKDKTCS